MLLPIVVMYLASHLGATRAVTDFAFAFSCLPAAGSTLVFAAPYKPSPQLVSVMTASLAVGKMVGFPLLFLSAAIFKVRHACIAYRRAGRQLHACNGRSRELSARSSSSPLSL